MGNDPIPDPAAKPREVNGEPVLSVVVPVLNGGAYIAESVEAIRLALVDANVDAELIVVSDGSVDDTVERALEAHLEVRVIHYDRNIGKGYAVKLGLLAARGQYAGFIDADLDLHPSELAGCLAAMQREGLDAAIGSKRHPLSVVDYPAQRRVYSWLYQQLVRVLFRLDVRDTQVGMKLFRRELVDAVVPHLLVKRYAFDLELLAVARDFGFDRIAEQPVRLEYQFSGSGIRPIAIGQALWDTAAVFYRIRVLRYYRRRRAIVGERRDGATRVGCTVVVVGEPGPLAAADAAATMAALAALEQSPEAIVDATEGGATEKDITAQRLAAIEAASTEVVCFITAGAVPTVTWLDGLLAYLGNPDVVAVGGPIIPAQSPHLADAAAAAVYESRFAAGPIAQRHVPGNLRETADQSLTNIAVRRSAAIASGCFVVAAARRHDGDVARALTRQGRVLFAPDAPVVREMPRLVRPLLASVHRHGLARGRALGELQGAPLSVLPPALLTAAVLLAPLAPGLPAGGRRGLRACGAAYATALAYAGGHAALRHRRPAVGAALVAAAPAAHLAYGAGVLRGVVEPRVDSLRRRFLGLERREGERPADAATSAE